MNDDHDVESSSSVTKLVARGMICACLLLLLLVTFLVSQREQATQRKPELCFQIAILNETGEHDKNTSLIEATLEEYGQFACEILSVEDVHRGKLKHDIALVPGGSASSLYRELGPAGRQALTDHVDAGGGYLGICAGAFLASSDPKRGLNLLDVTTLDGTHDIPGWGEVEIFPRKAGAVRVELTPEGMQDLGCQEKSMTINYRGGPLFPLAQLTSTSNVQTLATFGTEMCSYDFQKGTMRDTPAILFGEYGHGKVLAISPHPEENPDLNDFLRHAALFVAPEKIHEQNHADNTSRDRASFSLGPVITPEVSLTPAKLEYAIQKLQLTEKSPLSGLLHAIAVFGWDMPLPGSDEALSQHTFRDAILNDAIARQYFGKSLFYETRHGIKNFVAPAGLLHLYPERQAHWGQLLSEFARVNFPLEEQFGPQGQFSVRKLLDEAVAQYNPDEPQNEWTCVAFARLLPGQGSWKNKFGDEFDFTGMANNLMRKDLDAEGLSCYGIHILEALVVIQNADQKHSLLTEECRLKVKSYLEDKIATLVKTQRPDGGWGIEWNKAATLKFSISELEKVEQRYERVHITGHHASWMLMLPHELIPENEVFQRASDYLLTSLLEASGDEIQEHYCPYSHAGHTLLVLSSDENIPFAHP